ncbi:hypothetical protein [Burkholderia ubonensis]|uniref:hypothetical protein n=1 Tax=Burkholderia ubonensis TaxID=101571 RepID=UPI000AB6203E|nr:hypothetical protein [Burkholderia ubonensis]
MYSIVWIIQQATTTRDATFATFFADGGARGGIGASRRSERRRASVTFRFGLKDPEAYSGRTAVVGAIGLDRRTGFRTGIRFSRDLVATPAGSLSRTSSVRHESIQPIGRGFVRKRRAAEAMLHMPPPYPRHVAPHKFWP